MSRVLAEAFKFYGGFTFMNDARHALNNPQQSDGYKNDEITHDISPLCYDIVQIFLAKLFHRRQEIKKITLIGQVYPDDLIGNA